ncbi:MAG TPA: ribonuclease HII [Alphaproteobacteria bacterium]|jgi:ribonuclease HII|nr:ribonuclease HII [Micavibrio sp.]MBK9563011.1 ribonuclease HII [Micavibrio sp.]HQX27242.1 ribonuclease HII [Alphaproteobacteria bacterium]
MSSKLPIKAIRVKARPDFSIEDSIGGLVCGLDEVGRGPLAGPVVAACVYIPAEKRNLKFVSEIRDSKKLLPQKLETLFDFISEHFVFALTEISPQIIDQINILQASLLAMKKSHEQIKAAAITHALVDGNKCPALSCPATAVIKGDGRSVSIAAASIIAKVTRDRLMEKLAEEHPHYGWERNVGYPTVEHMSAIDRHGITDHHRRTFAPVRNFIEFGSVHRPLSQAV